MTSPQWKLDLESPNKGTLKWWNSTSCFGKYTYNFLDLSVNVAKVVLIHIDWAFNGCVKKSGSS